MSISLGDFIGSKETIMVSLVSNVLLISTSVKKRFGGLVGPEDHPRRALYGWGSYRDYSGLPWKSDFGWPYVSDCRRRAL